MSEEYQLAARVERGRLILGLPALQRLRAAVADWHACPVTVTVTRKRATRSLEQNAWYWGAILLELSKHTGYTVDELHEYCKLRFNAKRVAIVDANGEVKDESRIGLSTTALDRLTFGAYCEAIREWAAADLGVVIPDPDPTWRDGAVAG